MKKEIIYADIKLDGSENWFAITPEGNEFTFPPDRFSEKSEDTLVVDPDTKKTYSVRFHD